MWRGLLLKRWRSNFRKFCLRWRKARYLPWSTSRDWQKRANLISMLFQKKYVYCVFNFSSFSKNSCKRALKHVSAWSSSKFHEKSAWHITVKYRKSVQSVELLSSWQRKESFGRAAERSDCTAKSQIQKLHASARGETCRECRLLLSELVSEIICLVCSDPWENLSYVTDEDTKPHENEEHHPRLTRNNSRTRR